ncbi:unnamed protein product [Nippostrongylus brasiliensis]|uniref:Nuclear receptor domain-containing protein n=1 Tax=Nippostrongylus brasiliensis TaxID=27835 RepID=A0A0N4XXC0_NIPBR|nr:unnamed protein product [Nippostrongylus brasiliensis]
MPTSCAVCEMPSSGMHFGVSCCRACAAFFRRTLSLRLKYKCRFSGMCEVTQNSVVQIPTSVDSFEIQKPSSSNPGSNASYSSCSPPEPIYRIPTIVRNDNYQQTNTIAVCTTNAPNLDFHSNAQMILKAKIDVMFDMDFNLSVFPYTIPLSVSQQAMIAYANHSQHWPECGTEVNDIDIEVYMRETYTEIEHFAQFAILAEDVHSYYTYELRMPNYAARLHKMSSIVSAVDKLQERRKEDSQLSRMFNIFKQDIFFSELG